MKLVKKINDWLDYYACLDSSRLNYHGILRKQLSYRLYGDRKKVNIMLGKEELKDCEELLKTFKRIPESERMTVISYAQGFITGYEMKNVKEQKAS